ncbi:UNVERIFIED_CONTAM: hypothetical protein Slati_0126900 [Sesamum latifolium]|uniref:DDE Tnp4 domain-containing protein n=1 Tax=Sesamum latifolium TaxID=2727402 RepID=A0AAW2Y9F6_9LAMI
MRSGRTISMCFHRVFNSVCKLYETFFARPVPIGADCVDSRWRWFKGCLGALDGTYIDVRVPDEDKGRFRTRKGHISVNVLGVCNMNMQFIYVLTGWEGSAADSRVLHDAVTRPGGLRVPTDFPIRIMSRFEDEGSSTHRRRGSGREKFGTRRTWSVKEEQTLVNGLKSLGVSG